MIKLDDLEKELRSKKLPKHPIKLDTCTTITNCNKFIDNHILTLRGNKGNKTFIPYYLRLLKLNNLC